MTNFNTFQTASYHAKLSIKNKNKNKFASRHKFEVIKFKKNENIICINIS